MNLTREQEGEFAGFPPVLRELVLAELAAGNEIIEFAHGFPAAPCGACIKLARPVTSRPRQKTPELDFYERNGSSHAGEFTDAKRHFFVLEAPHPPPPEPDMDAIRQAHEPKPAPLDRVAQREAAVFLSDLPGTTGVRPAARESYLPEPAPARTNTPEPPAFTNCETATGWSRVLHFRDKRPPHAVQFALERDLTTLFVGAMDNGKLCLRARVNLNGAEYRFELRFEAALDHALCYSLHTESSWADQPVESHDYFRQASDHWYRLWTRDLMAARPPGGNDGQGERFRTLCEAALRAEAHLDTVTAVQRAIVDGLQQGGSFSTSHKEGGTRIFWRNGKFARSDYGDCPALTEFLDEAAFLPMLRQFCQCAGAWSTGKDLLPELDIWKRILRRMQPP